MDGKEEVEGGELEGIASLALLPSGSVSGHFLHPASATCLGLFGTEIACERECSRGEDYRLLNFTIINFSTKKEVTVVVERKGQDAARLSTACDVHGWDEEVVREATNNHGAGKKPLVIFFECDTLKADKEAEDHVMRFLPSLVGCDAVVNIGRMTIKGLQLDINEDTDKDGIAEDVKPEQATPQSKRGAVDLMQFVHEELEVEGFVVDNEVGKVPVSGILSKRQKVSTPPAITSLESHEKGNFRPSSLDHQSPDSF